jgi:hypothetical protein
MASPDYQIFTAKVSLTVRSKENFGVSVYKRDIWTLLCGGSGHRAMMRPL